MSRGRRSLDHRAKEQVADLWACPNNHGTFRLEIHLLVVTSTAAAAACSAEGKNTMNANAWALEPTQALNRSSRLPLAADSIDRNFST
jgi:hypothetical protein